MWKILHGPLVTVADGPVHEHIGKPARADGADGEELAGDPRPWLAGVNFVLMINLPYIQKLVRSRNIWITFVLQKMQSLLIYDY